MVLDHCKTFLGGSRSFGWSNDGNGSVVVVWYEIFVGVNGSFWIV